LVLILDGKKVTMLINLTNVKRIKLGKVVYNFAKDVLSYLKRSKSKPIALCFFGL
jgi:hypothetical protein